MTLAILATGGRATAAAPDASTFPAPAAATPTEVAAPQPQPETQPGRPSPKGNADPTSQPGYPYLSPEHAPSSPPAPSLASPPPLGSAPTPRRRRPRTKRRFLAMPFVGIHTYQHEAAYNTDPGLRFGGFLGGRVSDLFSLNGEVHLDLTNPGDLPAGTKVRELTVVATFSPLLQIHEESLELVLGPKIGALLVHQSRSDGFDDQASGYGVEIGVNVGLFRSLSPATSLGVLMSFELAKLSGACAQDLCVSAMGLPTSEILSLTAAALF